MPYQENFSKKLFSCCELLALANGVDIKTTQSLMRHSTASLTLSIYVHKDNQRMAAAVAALPTIY